jgi:iron complex transport system ATP-binding protein
VSIQVERLSYSYRSREVLHDISFSQQAHSLLCLLGPNGVGKSTLFRCILGLLAGYTGDIRISGQKADTLSANQLARHIAYVPQSHSPAFSYSVMDMVLMGTTSQFSVLSVPGVMQRRQAEEALEQVGISRLSRQSFMQLSGGERQLVLIARALAQQARILIMDEPTANLDYGNQLRVLQTVKQLAQTGYTILQSTHNPDQALLFADQVLALQEGRVLAFGSPREVISAELIHSLYGIEIALEQLYDGAVSLCIPQFAIPEIKRNHLIRSVF